jgi:hypothetical protein
MRNDQFVSSEWYERIETYSIVQSLFHRFVARLLVRLFQQPVDVQREQFWGFIGLRPYRVVINISSTSLKGSETISSRSRTTTARESADLVQSGLEPGITLERLLHDNQVLLVNLEQGIDINLWILSHPNS